MDFGAIGGIPLGGRVIKNGVMLAPMAGATDHAMRVICRGHGMEYSVSEMVSAKAMSHDDKKTRRLYEIRDDDGMMGVQIFGSDPETMARAARTLAEGTPNRPAAIDINMGCPVPKIVKNGDGSALMRSPKLAADIVRACAHALEGTGIPVTVKIRAGWEGNKNAVEVAKRVEDAGVSMITVHGRTREQMYSPPVDLEIIADVKDAVSAPVVGNGDVRSWRDAVEMLDKTGVDGIAIGRGALGNPWIFEEINAHMNGVDWTPPTPAERIAEAIKHAELLVADKGGRIGLFESRKHLAWYIHGMRGAPEARDRIMRAETLDEMRDILLSMEAALL